MTVVANPINSALVISYQTGVTTGGSPMSKTKTLNYVREDVPEQVLYEIAHALLRLTAHPVLDVVLRKNFELIDEQD